MKPSTDTPLTFTGSAFSSSPSSSGGLQFFLVRRSAVPASLGSYASSPDDAPPRHRWMPGHVTDLFLCPLGKEDGNSHSASSSGTSSQAIMVPPRRQPKPDGMVGVSPARDPLEGYDGEEAKGKPHPDGLSHVVKQKLLPLTHPSPSRYSGSTTLRENSVVIGRQSPCLKWALGENRHISRDLLTFSLRWPQRKEGQSGDDNHVVRLGLASTADEVPRILQEGGNVGLKGVRTDVFLTHIPQVFVEVKHSLSSAHSVWLRSGAAMADNPRLQTNGAITDDMVVCSGKVIPLSVGDCIQVGEVILELGAVLVAPLNRIPPPPPPPPDDVPQKECTSLLSSRASPLTSIICNSNNHRPDGTVSSNPPLSFCVPYVTYCTTESQQQSLTSLFQRTQRIHRLHLLAAHWDLYTRYNQTARRERREASIATEEEKGENAARIIPSEAGRELAGMDLSVPSDAPSASDEDRGGGREEEILVEEEEAAATPSPSFDLHTSTGTHAGVCSVSRSCDNTRKRQREGHGEAEVAVALFPHLDGADGDDPDETPRQHETVETFSFQDHLEELLGAIPDVSDRPPQLQRRGLQRSPGHSKSLAVRGRAGRNPSTNSPTTHLLQKAPSRCDSRPSMEETQNTFGGDYADYLQESVEIHYYD